MLMALSRPGDPCQVSALVSFCSMSYTPAAVPAPPLGGDSTPTIPHRRPVSKTALSKVCGVASAQAAAASSPYNTACAMTLT